MRRVGCCLFVRENARLHGDISFATGLPVCYTAAMDKKNLEVITEFRHELHRHPELSLQETETIKKIHAFLENNTSLYVEEGDGWLFAVKEGTDPEAGGIAFRADMDALPIDEQGTGLVYISENPGVSHKCGHDGHCAALAGLALELDKTEVVKTVYLIFQCAEEIGAGAVKAAGIIKEKGIREIYAFHNLSGYPEGSIVYRRGLTQPASEGLTVAFSGKTSHAGAPEEGRNPSAAIAKTVLFIRELNARPREGMAFCTVVGMEAGSGDFGISAGFGKLMVTLRAEEEQEMKSMEEEIISFAERQAAEEGICISSDISDYFPETRNTEAGIQKVLRAAGECGRKTVEMENMWRVSEDFGHFLKKCEGAIFYIGNGEDWPPLHTSDYDFNDRILTAAVEMFRALAVMPS